MAIQDELKKAVGTAIHTIAEQNQIKAVIGIPDGDGTYTLQDEANPHRVWVTTEVGTFLEVANKGAALIAGLPVILEVINGDLTIIGVDHARAAAVLGSGFPLQAVAPHTHRIGYGLDDLVEEKRFEPGLLYAGDDLEVRVLPFWYAQDGYWPDLTTLDLVGNQPSSGSHRWVRVGFDPSGPSLEAANGTAVPVTIPLNVVDIASIALSASTIIPIGAVKLDGDQTTWHGPGDFVSARTLLGVESGAGVDADAIHDNVAGEIAAVAEKGSPISGDLLLIEDSADGNNKKRVQVGNLPSSGASLELAITAGENLSELDYVYLNPADNEWYQVDIDDATPEISADRAIVTESGGITASGTGTAQRIGVVGGFTGLSAGDPVYAHTTAGGYTQTKPAPTDGGAQLAIVRIGVAISTTQILLTPEDRVTYVKRDTLAEDDTLTIVHHSDPLGRTRTPRAYATNSTPGVPIEENDSANQTGGFDLRGTSLLTNLVAYWDLTEANGVRADSIGGNDLADYNTVLSGTGVGGVDVAADFERDNLECLFIADNADLSTGDIDFMIACWINIESKAAANVMNIVSKWDYTGNDKEYTLFHHGPSDRFQFYVSSDGTAASGVTASTFGAPALATWYFIVCYHDAANNLIGISVNGGAFDTAAYSSGVVDGTADFVLGGQSDYVATNFFDGKIAAAGLWKRILTSAEITQLYQGRGGGAAGSAFLSDEFVQDKQTQIFTLDNISEIGSADLYLKKIGAPAGTATVRIETVAGGNPTGVLADANATITFAEATVGAGYADINVVFPAPFTLAAGTYALVLSTSRAASETDYIIWGADITPSYGAAGEEMQWYETATWHDFLADAIFTIYDAGTQYEEPRIIRAWSLDDSENIIARYDDGVDANPNTKTTFKNTDAASVDLTCIVEVG